MIRFCVVLVLFSVILYLISCSPDPVSPGKKINTPPSASFTVNPDSGDTATIFEFDATASVDGEDSNSVLKVRWNWDEDDKWDTEYSTQKVITHQFGNAGIKRIKLEVMDSGGLMDTTSRITYIALPNTPPVASFTINPDSGDTKNIFKFDATNSFDSQDPSSVLQIRWDWENDGIWDSGYSTVKTATHQYLTNGLYDIALEVKDTKGLTDTAIVGLAVSIPNDPPIANFAVEPVIATIFIDVTFDASASQDSEDEVDMLQVRWDWENDDIWDTGFSTKKLISHKFAIKGVYTVRLEVKDSGNLSGLTTRQVSVVGETGTVTDVDNNVYRTVKIGDQWWMAENLKVTHYRNGEAILNLSNNTDWTNTTSGAYCVFGNNESYIEDYGLLYNGYAVEDSRNIAPESWHIPTDEDWKKLEIYLGMSEDELNMLGMRGTDEGGKLKEKGRIYWNPPNEGVTNEYGFSARGGGSRNKPGVYEYLRMGGYWWSSTSSEALYAGTLYGRFINYFSPIIWRGTYTIQAGMSVRCIKD
jgi:uncharacterized protein (TIGR02145 family)